MSTVILGFTLSMIVGLFIRLAFHKYTSKEIVALNPYVFAMLFLVFAWALGISNLPLVIGFYLVDISFYVAKFLDKRGELNKFLLFLSNHLPEKKEPNEDTNEPCSGSGKTRSNNDDKHAVVPDGSVRGTNL